jgi:hypothetical protein
VLADPGRLENKGTIEVAQKIAAHEFPRTTKLSDRTDDQAGKEFDPAIRLAARKALPTDDYFRQLSAMHYPEPVLLTGKNLFACPTKIGIIPAGRRILLFQQPAPL